MPSEANIVAPDQPSFPLKHVAPASALVNPTGACFPDALVPGFFLIPWGIRVSMSGVGMWHIEHQQWREGQIYQDPIPAEVPTHSFLRRVDWELQSNQWAIEFH